MNKKWNIFLFFLPCILLLPVLYYSLSTSFALVDDYSMWFYVEYLDNAQAFTNWMKNQFIVFDAGRYRPFFDLYNMVTWKFFGASPWLHHLARWLLHVLSIISFASAFLLVKSKDDNSFKGAKHPAMCTVSLAFLVYVWLFFPNSPVSRLGPQELYTVFFMGLSNLAIAVLVAKGRGYKKSFFVYLGLYLGFIGIALSKEVNIAILFWIVLFYFSYFLYRRQKGSFILGIPLVLFFLYTFFRVYFASKTSSYGVAPITLELLVNNVIWIYKGLFLLDTSRIIQYVFMLLLLPVGIVIGSCLYQKKFTAEFWYLLFLSGQFISLYAILATSWAPVTRYYYGLIPSLSILFAFSVKNIIQWTFRLPRPNADVMVLGLVSFLIYFIGCNYYNFTMQTVVQHSLRHAEERLIREVETLHDNGAYLYIPMENNDPDLELSYHLTTYFKRFAHRFYGKEYVIYNDPPQASDHRAYYLVTKRMMPAELDRHRVISNTQEKEYPILFWGEKISAFFQGKKKAYVATDAGVHLMHDYQWFIYGIKG